ncbi:MAG: AAA family ATPase [Candidatus Paracaedibacteraceae bacterium]|nr:AAA family ATPase [Candidatus Paracaedibacteraceae bacterium]
MKNYILTGTPGSGKTTLLENLKTYNFNVISEAATDVIAQEQAKGIAEPWTDPSFIDKIVLLQQERYLLSVLCHETVQFFDRSPLCTYALALYLGYPPSSLLLEEIERIQQTHSYERNVFFIENLGFIAKTDARQISFEEALKFEKIHRDTYHQFGFNCIPVPKASVQTRINYMIEKL